MNREEGSESARVFKQLFLATKSAAAGPVQEVGGGEKATSGVSFDEEVRSAQARERASQERFTFILAKVLQRQEFIKRHFLSATALNDYVARHPATELVRRRMAAEVAAKRAYLNGTAEPKKSEGKGRKSDEGHILEEYVSLARLNIVAIETVFPEAPEPVDLCDLKQAIEELPKHEPTEHIPRDKAAEALKQALDSEIQYLGHRWRVITGLEAPPETFPPRLSEMLKRKAPSPAAPMWSYSRYGAEARAMRLSGYEKGWHTKSHSNGSGVIASTREREKEDSRREETAESARQVCDARGLLLRASGGQVPEPPRDDEPRYTFPQRLRHAEDIFYDYSILIPVQNECGPCKSEYSEENRSLLAIKVLTGKAKAVLDFLNDMGLSAALGEYPDAAGGMVPVAQEVEHLLARAASLLSTAGTLQVIDLRRDLREIAGILRLISRTEIWMPPPVSDFQTLSSQLAATASNVQVSQAQRAIPYKTDDKDAAKQTSTVLITPSADLPNVTHWHGTPTQTHGWLWNRWHQWDNVSPYLRHLGSDLYTKIDALKKKAQEVANAIQNVSLGYADYAEDFQKAAAGLINDASYVLAIVLDAMAEQLQFPRRLPAPGSKRLALQLVLRQYWFPEGYVQGKLVGYKTLIPSEKETLKRRTFVKTSVETTTAKEFASARQDDFSLTQRQTAEVVKEASNKFNFTTNSSGHFEFGVGGGDASVGMTLDLARISKAAHSTLAESVMKSSVSFSEKREVKIRELKETEDVQEVIRELQNANQEITANYFYYQLLRQYCVTTQLQDFRPVLLRAREIPSPAEIDDKWVSRYIHVLMHALPAQLAQDAQETVDELDQLARALIRYRAEANQLKADLDTFLEQGAPSEADKQAQWREELRSREMRLSEAREQYVLAEQAYGKARSRMERVAAHIRENICYYMQFVWQASPRVDHDMQLRQEYFCGSPLPEVTQGLNRIGYSGSEEMFEYNGKSVALFQALLRNLATGRELVDSAAERGEEWERLLSELEHNSCESEEDIPEKVLAAVFVIDPAAQDELFNARRVQVAEDALVVETMPGQVPLLEAFQLAHRMLDVEGKCLENEHLRARIADRPWQKTGEDSYAVRRYDGAAPVSRETVEK